MHGTVPKPSVGSEWTTAGEVDKIEHLTCDFDSVSSSGIRSLYFCTPDEDSVESACVSLFLVCRCIGKYISLELYYSTDSAYVPQTNKIQPTYADPISQTNEYYLKIGSLLFMTVTVKEQEGTQQCKRQDTPNEANSLLALKPVTLHRLHTYHCFNRFNFILNYHRYKLEAS